MSDETYKLELGGKSWDIPVLPFKLVKKIQPVILQVYTSLGGSALTVESMSNIDEAVLDKVLGAVQMVAGHVDKDVTVESLNELPFSVVDLMMTFPVLAQCCGFKPALKSAVGGSAAAASGE
jgi:hypothetical protein